MNLSYGLRIIVNNSSRNCVAISGISKRLYFRHEAKFLQQKGRFVSGLIRSFEYSQKMSEAFVYIMTNRHKTVFYTGATRDLVQRVHRHKHGSVNSFTGRFKLYFLVYFEVQPNLPLALNRERQIKKWRRRWKIELIESINPMWNDLCAEFIAKSTKN